MKVRVVDLESFGFNADNTANGCQAELCYSPVSGDEKPKFELSVTKKLYEDKEKFHKTIVRAEEQIKLRCNLIKNKKALTNHHNS